MAPNIPGFNIALVRLAMDYAYAAYNGEGAFKGGKMIMASTNNEMYRPVFYLYERDSTLWVCVRGSGSQLDWNTDFEYNEMTATFGSNKINVHGGFYKSASNIYNDIKQKLYDYPGKILITGHSLGGAVASILSVMAMTDSKLTGKLSQMGGLCYAAAPALEYIPDNLVSKICIFVYNNDIVPTLSLPNAYNLLKPAIPKAGIPTFLLKVALKTTCTILKDKKQEFSQTLYNSIMAKIDPIVDDIAAYHKDNNHIKVKNVVGTVYALNDNAGKLSDCQVPGTHFNQLSISATSLDDHYQSKYIDSLKKKTD